MRYRVRRARPRSVILVALRGITGQQVADERSRPPPQPSRCFRAVPVPAWPEKLRLISGKVLFFPRRSTDIARDFRLWQPELWAGNLVLRVDKRIGGHFVDWRFRCAVFQAGRFHDQGRKAETSPSPLLGGVTLR